METDFLFPGKISPLKSPFDFLEQTDAYSHSEKIIRSCKEPGIYNWSKRYLTFVRYRKQHFLPSGRKRRPRRPLYKSPGNRTAERISGRLFPQKQFWLWLYQQLRWSANVHISRMIAGSIQKLLAGNVRSPCRHKCTGRCRRRRKYRYNGGNLGKTIRCFCKFNL